MKEMRQVKRNGYLPSRQIQTGLGNIAVEQPRIRWVSFTSVILPKYMRRLPSIEALIPSLYLKGIPTGDMQEALEAILCENAKGLSATNIVRLKESWKTEYSVGTREVWMQNGMFISGRMGFISMFGLQMKGLVFQCF